MASHRIDLELARVSSRQPPVFLRNGIAVCHELKLSATDAQRLFAEGLLSFDPQSAEPLDEAREAELVFVGTLATSGIDRQTLSKLLTDLEAPYSYRIDRVFFDFRLRQWRLLPELADPEAAFFSLLEHLDETHAAEALWSIRTWLDEALDVAREQDAFLHHHGGEDNASGVPDRADSK